MPLPPLFLTSGSLIFTRWDWESSSPTGLVGLHVAGPAFWLTQLGHPLLCALTSPPPWTSQTVNVLQCPSHVMHFSKQQTKVFLDLHAKKSSRFLIAQSLLTPKVIVSLSFSSSLHSCFCLEDFTQFNSNFLPSVSAMQLWLSLDIFPQMSCQHLKFMEFKHVLMVCPPSPLSSWHLPHFVKVGAMTISRQLLFFLCCTPRIHLSSSALFHFPLQVQMPDFLGWTARI